MVPSVFSSRFTRIVLLTFAAISFTQAVHAAEPAGAKHCLWRVTNAKAPFYLLGSFHELRSRDYALPPVIHQAIDESRQYWFEMDPRRGELFTKKLRAAVHRCGW